MTGLLVMSVGGFWLTLLYLFILSMLVMLPLGFSLYYGSRLKAAIYRYR